MRMLFGFAVLMLTMSVLGAQSQDRLPAKMIGTWCPSEDAAKAPLGTDIYHRSKDDPDGIGCAELLTVRQNKYDGTEMACTIKKTQRLHEDAYLVRALCESEGSLTTFSKFQISAGQLVVTRLEEISPKKKGRK